MLAIAAYWLEQDPERVEPVLIAIRRRANWLADGKWQLGSPIAGLSGDYRWFLERKYGYKLYYRVEGDPPTVLSLIAVRHSRQRPLGASSLREGDT